MEQVRLGFVGVGGMGQCAHLKRYTSLPGCQVVAIAEIREEHGNNVARRYGVPNVYRDHRDMLASENLDAIVASQPFTRHGVLVPELLRYGLPVFTEKPIAGSIEAAAKIVSAVENSKGWLMVGYHKRSDPATMAAKSEIDRLRQTGELGALKYVRILMPAGDWVAGGFNDLISTPGAGPQLEWDPPASDMSPEVNEAFISFVNYYIHQVNLMRHLLGESYTVEYAAPSGVMLAVRSDSGVAGVIEMSPYQSTIDWNESALVAFEKGFLQIELPAPLASNRPGKLTVFKDPGNGQTPQTVMPTLPWVDAMRQQAINYLAAVRGEGPPMCGAKEAYQDLVAAKEYIDRMHPQN